jgi:hypothetical protein
MTFKLSKYWTAPVNKNKIMVIKNWGKWGILGPMAHEMVFKLAYTFLMIFTE